MHKLKTHIMYYRIFLILSIVSVADIATRGIITKQFGLSDTGIISFDLGILYGAIHPTAGAIMTTFTSLILSFTILWIGIAVYEYTRIQKLKKLEMGKK